jgi:hypothetical protein
MYARKANTTYCPDTQIKMQIETSRCTLEKCFYSYDEKKRVLEAKPVTKYILKQRL